MNALPNSGVAQRRPTARSADVKLLGIYLNDHLAGATAGTERATRLVRTARGSALGRAIEPVAAEIAQDRTALLDIMRDLGRHGLDRAAEIAQDRTALLDIMRDLGIPVRRYKVCAGWAGEKLGRLKPNGHLVRRSPLGTVLDLEALRLGVEGKAACWQSLRRIGATDERVDPDRLDTLLERARQQQERIEEWRVRQAGEALATTVG